MSIYGENVRRKARGRGVDSKEPERGIATTELRRAARGRWERGLVSFHMIHDKISL